MDTGTKRAWTPEHDREGRELASAERRNFLKLAGQGGFTAAMVAGAGGVLWSSEAPTTS